MWWRQVNRHCWCRRVTAETQLTNLNNAHIQTSAFFATNYSHCAACMYWLFQNNAEMLVRITDPVIRQTVRFTEWQRSFIDLWPLFAEIHHITTFLVTVQFTKSQQQCVHKCRALRSSWTTSIITCADKQILDFARMNHRQTSCTWR